MHRGEQINKTPNSTKTKLNLSHAKKSKRVLVFGASGSVGKKSISFIEKQRDITVIAISVHQSIGFLEEYLASLPAKRELFIAITGEVSLERVAPLRREYQQHSFFLGEDSLCELVEAGAENGADTVIAAQSGSSGLKAIFLSLRKGLKIAIANKESLVLAGEIFQLELSSLREEGIYPSVIPLDSEHNSMLQLMENIESTKVAKYILTASGGPFFSENGEKTNENSFKNTSALQHPNWDMGPKISVDSSLMINKGLELIEAHFLFSLDYTQLDAVIQKDSIVHALLRLQDGTFLLSASVPDMIYPIAHSLYYPEAAAVVHTEKKLVDWPSLRFHEIHREQYPAYFLCREIAQRGGTAPAILNASNEVAVNAFLKNEIAYSEITRVIEETFADAIIETGKTIEIFLRADLWARKTAKKVSKEISQKR